MRGVSSWWGDTIKHRIDVRVGSGRRYYDRHALRLVRRRAAAGIPLNLVAAVAIVLLVVAVASVLVRPDPLPSWAIPLGCALVAVVLDVPATRTRCRSAGPSSASR